MKLFNQVNTIEQGKRLRELGIKGWSSMGINWEIIAQVDSEGKETGVKLPVLSRESGGCNDSLFIDIDKIPHGYPDYEEIDSIATYPAFSVAELGQMLNSETYSMRTGSELSEYANWDWTDQGNNRQRGPFATEAEARANLLIYLLERKQLTADEANKRLNA